MHKKEYTAQTSTRESYDLDDIRDKKEIEAFENDLKCYKGKQETVFGKILKGFDYLCYKNNFISYSKKYPNGAVRYFLLENYRIAKLKYDAYQKLLDRREEKKKEENERINSLN